MSYGRDRDVRLSSPLEVRTSDLIYLEQRFITPPAYEVVSPEVVPSPGSVRRMDLPEDSPDAVARHIPWFCYSIFVVNTGMLVYSFYEARWHIEPLDKNPMVGPNAEVLTELGAKVTAKIQAGEWWRLLTAMFLHAGVIHLVVNMAGVYQIGKSMEEDFGTLRLGAVYLLSGLSGNLLSASFLPLQITVGASGACFGLLGAAWGDLLQNSHLIKGVCCEAAQLSLCTVLSLGLGLMPLIDNFAHAGGFIAGILLGLALLPEDISADKEHTQVSWLRQACRQCTAANAGIVFGAFNALLLFVLFMAIDPSGWCSFCEHINCVPTPFWECNSASLAQCSGSVFSNGTTVIDCSDGSSCLRNQVIKDLTRDLCTACCS